MKKLLLFILGFGCLTLSSNVQGAETITFDNDSTGLKMNGFVSADSSVVSFTDALGIGLIVNDFGVESDGKGLGVFSSGQSYLTMEFSDSQNWLELEFGNDDPVTCVSGDEAVLTVFLDETQVGQTTVALNCDDIMNQSISISGMLFDKATFMFDVTDTDGLVEVVDNISFDNIVLPAPGAVFLVGVGTALCGCIRRRYFY